MTDTAKTYEQPDWVTALKDTGRETLERSGLPTPAWEDWKYSNLRPYARENFESADFAPQVETADLPRKYGDYRLVFVNGHFSNDLSDTVPGLTHVSLADALQQDEGQSLRTGIADVGDLFDRPIKAMNTAHINDGAVIRVEEGADLAGKVELLYYSTDENTDIKPAVFLRNLFIVEKDARCDLFENYAGTGTYASNHVCEIILKEQAEMKHYRLQEESDTAFHFTNTRLMQEKNSRYETVTMTIGGRFARHEIDTLLIASDVQCIIKGLYVLDGNQHSDTKILVDHMEPDGVSEQLYKGIVDDQARAVFQGKVHVRRPAQGTDGRQLNHALLLSEQAEIDAKPELEIYADDVQCAHGATADALDEEPLFYMRSRGIPENEARQLLMTSFLADVIRDLDDADMKALFEEKIQNWMSRK